MKNSKRIVFFGFLLMVLIIGSIHSTAIDTITSASNTGEEYLEAPRTFCSGRLLAWQELYHETPSVQYNRRADYFSPVRSSILYNIGGSVEPYNFTGELEDNDMSPNILKSKMSSASIFMYHSHGLSGRIVIGPTASDYFAVSQLPNSLLSLQCALMMTCYGANTTNTYPTSFIQGMVNKGATSAIGFSGVVLVDDCNLFAERFASIATVSGNTVYQGVYNMSTIGMSINILNVTYIKGNAYTMLN